MSEEKEFHFKVPSIACSGCSETIVRVLKNSEKITALEVDVNVVKKTVFVKVCSRSKATGVELDEDQIFNIIRAELRAVNFDFGPGQGLRNHIIKGVVGTLSGLILMLLPSLGIVMSLAGMQALSAAATLLTLYLGKESYLSAFKRFSTARLLTMDTLFAVSTLMAIGVSIASHLIPWLPMMFDAALLIFGFRHFGLAIETAAKQKVISDLDFVDRAPQNVAVVEGDKVVMAARKEIVPGQIIRVKKGAIIPLDGIYRGSKTATVFDTIISGRDMPVSISDRKELLAGMYVGEDVEFIDVEVTGGSYLEELDRSFEMAKKKKAEIETSADKMLQYFVPAVFAFALFSGVAIAVSLSVVLAIQTSIAILVAACPCVLGFITPLMVALGKAKAAEQGAMVSDGSSFENFAKVNTIFFDMNGTLTQGRSRVSYCKIESHDEQEVLRCLYAVEKKSKSKHPVVGAICDFIEYEKKVPGLDGNEFDNLAVNAESGTGLSAVIAGHRYAVGNCHMMEEECGTKPCKNENESAHVIYIARDKKIIGQMQISDPLRDEAKDVVNYFRQQGVRVCILTGAPEMVAQHCAQQLTIPLEDVIWNARSKDKQQFISDEKASGKIVAMVGDAANDAVAIEESHVGIAVDSPSRDKMTYQNAGIIVNKGSLLPIVNAYVVAGETVNHIKRSLIISFGYNLVAMLLPTVLVAATGIVLNPALGVVLMVAQSCLVLADGWYFRQRPLPHCEYNRSARVQPGAFTSLDAHRRIRSLVTGEPSKNQMNQSVTPMPASHSGVGASKRRAWRSNRAIVNSAEQHTSSPRNMRW